MENPEKEAHIPEPKRERGPRAPREFNDVYSGSTAGAGSGEYHVYRRGRDLEHKRLQAGALVPPLTLLGPVPYP